MNVQYSICIFILQMYYDKSNTTDKENVNVVLSSQQQQQLQEFKILLWPTYESPLDLAWQTGSLFFGFKNWHKVLTPGS